MDSCTGRTQLHLTVLSNTFLVITNTLQENTPKASVLATFCNILSTLLSIMIEITFSVCLNWSHRITPHHPLPVKTKLMLFISYILIKTYHPMPSWHIVYEVPLLRYCLDQKKRKILLYGHTSMIMRILQRKPTQRR